MDCLFCKIAKKEIPAEIIYEDDNTVAFLDIQPIAPGHAMVIPKDHAENVLDLPDEKVGPVFLTIKTITAILNTALRPSGFTVGINHGKAAGQAIDHLHVHVIPRFAGDGGKSMHSIVKNPPQESIKEIANKLKKINENRG
ncbi:MAG: HIT family protein [bacterium]|nr:HIT family protein [bacterium]